MSSEFSATVPASCKAAVESLFFFNPRQEALLGRIRATIEQTGTPTIIEADGRVWLDVPQHPMQCLFVCDPAGAPLGVALYTRPAVDQLWIVHLATSLDAGQNEPLETSPAVMLVEQIRMIARAIRGVARIRLPYGERCLTVRPATVQG
jgi:hypothetical protein